MENLDYIAAPVPLEILKKELTEERFVRHTNKGNNMIYVVNHHNSPNVMREIGRLREVTFASAGGGTGKPLDIDEFDTSEHCYEQLIVWAPEAQEIIGGYRFIDCAKILTTNPIELSTRHYFSFSDKFKKEYLPYTVELGRSWVQPNFQPRAGSRKGIFALDNLWDGLGAIVVDNPHVKYYYGKVTMYTSYNTQARDALMYFMDTLFGDKEQLVQPLDSIEISTDILDFKESIKGLEYKEAHKVLNSYVRDRGENIPPLINSYMSLSPTMKSFGTAINKDFGGVEETGILVKIADIYDEKKARHVDTYKTQRY
ncbi:MAG: GNAT family N-acetyltransferase [Bacteroidia bacterium]|nr:GNAT family N-acetyltransferase [Bacteroidia bacterium]